MYRTNNNPIIILEANLDDQVVINKVFEASGYPNKIIFFPDGQSALDFLNQSDMVPFLILSNINLPRLDGFSLRNKVKMDAELQVKCVPYIFFSNNPGKQVVIDAYSSSAQGFFEKDNKFEDLKETIDVIMKYWHKCVSPNNFGPVPKKI